MLGDWRGDLRARHSRGLENSRSRARARGEALGSSVSFVCCPWGRGESRTMSVKTQAAEDAQLIQRLKAKDEAALEALTAQYEAKVFGPGATNHRESPGCRGGPPGCLLAHPSEHWLVSRGIQTLDLDLSDYDQYGLDDCPGCLAFINTYRHTVHLSKELRCEDIPPELQHKLRTFIKQKLQKPSP